MIGVETTPALGGNGMNADLDALATRLYVTIDDLLKDHPHWHPNAPLSASPHNFPMPS